MRTRRDAALQSLARGGRIGSRRSVISIDRPLSATPPPQERPLNEGTRNVNVARPPSKRGQSLPGSLPASTRRYGYVSPRVDLDSVACMCWCEHTVVYIPPEAIGKTTASCGRPNCQPPKEAS